jgi:hypothetical protein
VAGIINGNRERQVSRIIADDKDGPRSNISARNNAVEVDQRQLVRHGETETSVVGMIGIRASILVPQETVRPERVVVRPLWRGCNGQRHFPKNFGLEDTLRADQRNSDAVENESLGQDLSRQDVTELCDLLGKPVEAGRSYSRIVDAIKHLSEGKPSFSAAGQRTAANPRPSGSATS